MIKTRNKTIERIYLNKEEFVSLENEIRLHEHLRRYAAVRRYCYGKILDFACGCGYGSYLLASNPEVKSIVAVDKDENALSWARQEYSHVKITHLTADIETLNESFDTLVSLETIEHMQDLKIIQGTVNKCDIKHLIISFPDKKSTHFNPFHVHDFAIQDVIDLFPRHVAYHAFKMGDVQFILFMQIPDNAPTHIFRNILDL